jgi:acyl carrier protein
LAEPEQVFAFFQRTYRRVRGSTRDVRRTDRLDEDLAIDSLLATELLVAIEDRYSVELMDDSRTWEVRTVGELIDLVETVRV